MRLFHSAVVAISMFLMLPLGSSATATTHSRPQFATEGRTLDLRETGSKIVMETIEDALRQGGVALLGDGFQIDSSLGWVFGEDIESIDGGIDAAIPLLSKNGHIVFTQPGLVFWEGNGEEERIDANFGIVYRTDLANTPIGIDAIGGVSLFYDYDFHRVGHERISIGADIQTDNFHGAFNYYHPLSNEEDGREGFIEDPLKGVDLRIALERSVVRAGARVGLWRFDGGEYVSDDWRVSVGGDVGLRIFPGVFIEGDWEKHQEDFIVDQRFKLGLAFRFSLPGFEGRSYAGGSKSTDLYKVVDREKRILYEERASTDDDAVEIDDTDETTGRTIGLLASSSSFTIEEGDTESTQEIELNTGDSALLASLLTTDITLTARITIEGDEDNDSSNDIRVSIPNISATTGMLSSGSAVVTVLPDMTFEEQETVTIVLEDGNNELPNEWSIDTNNNTVTVIIPANDHQKIGISSSARSFSLTEGDSNTVARSFLISVGDPTALAAILTNDVTLTTTITIQGDENNDVDDDIETNIPIIDAITGLLKRDFAFTVRVKPDTIPEAQEIAIIVLEDGNNQLPSGWIIDPETNTITVTIIDND